MASIAVSARDAQPRRIEAEQGGFFGYLSSPRHNPCELNRKVLLYKQKGDQHNRGVDTLIGVISRSRTVPIPSGTSILLGQVLRITKQTQKCQADFSRACLLRVDGAGHAPPPADS